MRNKQTHFIGPFRFSPGTIASLDKALHHYRKSRSEFFHHAAEALIKHAVNDDELLLPLRFQVGVSK